MINSNTGKLDSAVAQDREARASDEYKAHIDKLAKSSKGRGQMELGKETCRNEF